MQQSNRLLSLRAKRCNLRVSASHFLAIANGYWLVVRVRYHYMLCRVTSAIQCLAKGIEVLR